jgi:hypothetical protein
MSTMTNLHDLLPCALCSARMAVPGGPICTMCDAVTLPAMVPDDTAALQERPHPHRSGHPGPTSW